MDRNLLDGELWSAPAEYLKVWMFILLKVPYSSTDGHPAGQRVFRREKDQIPHVSRDQWIRALLALKKRGSITLKPVRQGVLITVTNWPKYQSVTVESQLPLWFTSFAADWKARTGGILHPKAAQDLTPIVTEHGVKAALANWKNYLGAVQPRFLRSSNFAETFGSWSTPGGKRAHAKRKQSREQLDGHAGTTDYSVFDSAPD